MYTADELKAIRTALRIMVGPLIDLLTSEEIEKWADYAKHDRFFAEKHRWKVQIKVKNFDEGLSWEQVEEHYQQRNCFVGSMSK